MLKSKYTFLSQFYYLQSQAYFFQCAATHYKSTYIIFDTVKFIDNGGLCYVLSNKSIQYDKK